MWVTCWPTPKPKSNTPLSNTLDELQFSHCLLCLHCYCCCLLGKPHFLQKNIKMTLFFSFLFLFIGGASHALDWLQFSHCFLFESSCVNTFWISVTFTSHKLNIEKSWAWCGLFAHNACPKKQLFSFEEIILDIMISETDTVS